MSPGRFDQVQDLYLLTLERAEESRAAFLDEVCGADDELRQEVESLLAHETRAAAFMEETLNAVARELILSRRQLPAGTRIGHYEVVSFIAAGGMGEVYRSRDTRLKRDVAIKVLAPEWSEDTNRVQRLKREAELLAAMNHPRIAQIYGFEESVGTFCIVLEFVEGETLADRLAQGPIPEAQALEIARQIAEALEAAHERGIIHRDLKPANVKLTPDGNVKVLDFGLAKALVPAAASAHSDAPVDRSLPGMIVGTAGYMSPEQAKGREVDARSDIWSFGCVLYETLTGKTAFTGDSIVETLSAVLGVEPDWDALPSSTPPAVRALLKRCLRKDRNRRLRDIADARFQLEDIPAADGVPYGQAVPAPDSRPSRSKERVLWIAAVLALSLIALWPKYARTLHPAPTEMRLQIVTPPDASSVGFSLSPDGRKLVYSAQGRLWLRSLDSEQPELLPATDGAAVNTFWPPDSLAFGFYTSDRLMRFDLGGNLARTLSNVPAGVGVRGVTWNGKGNLLVGSPGDHMPLYLLASSDSAASEATSLAAGQTTQGYPYFLPDGNRFLFLARTAAGQGIYVGSLDSKETRRLFDSDSGAVFYPPDYALFARRGSLLGQRLDMKEWKPVGEPVSVSSEVFVDMSVGSTSVRGVVAAAASAVGSLAFRAHAGRTQLAWVDREGKILRKIAGTEQTADPRQAEDVSLSPDGRTAAFARIANGNKDLWLVDLESGTPRRFTFNEGWEGFPTWSPDGKHLVFSSLRKGILDLYRRPASGTEPEQLLLETHEGKAPDDWSPDGRYLLFQTSNPRTSDDLWVLPLDGAFSPTRVIATEALECCGRFSPDGRFIVYQSWETGRSEIYAQPFMREGGKQRISIDGGVTAKWRPDGKELFYRASDGRLMSVATDLSGGYLKTGTPEPLFRLPTPVYLPSRDGKSFLTNVVTEPASPITILLNWDPSAKK